MSSSTPAAGLKSNAIGLLGATTLGVVFLSPAMTLYGLFGPIFLEIGKSAPMAFVFALLITLPTAYSYSILSRDYPSSGSAAEWATLATGPRIGAFAGWLVFLCYLTNFTIQPVALGLFFIDLLSPLNSMVCFWLGVGLGLACPAWIVYRGITISTRGALAFLIVEIIVVVSLCATVLILAPQRGTPLSLDGFLLSLVLSNQSSLLKAMVFGMLAFCGFDVISTVAEETRMARTLIPKATALALVVYAVFIIIGMWALTLGGDPDQLREVAQADRMPIIDVATTFWGRGSVLVTLTAISATLGLTVVTAVGASRVLYSNGRRGTAPAIFSRLHSQYQVPWNALHVILICGFIGALVLYSAMGAYDAFQWWLTTTTFFAMMTYLFVNLSVPILYRHRIRESFGSFFLFAVVPGFGIIVDAYILVQSFFVELWAKDWATGKSIVVFDVSCAVLALVFAMFAKPRQSI